MGSWVRIMIAAVVAFSATVPEGMAGVSVCTGGSSATSLCPATGTCTITSKKVINAGATIDCSGRDIVLKANVVVSGGTFTLRARNITVNGNYAFEAQESDSVRVGFELIPSGTLDVMGRLLARNRGKGSFIIVRAGGDVLVRSGLGVDASGAVTSANGGDLLLEARDITIQSKLDVNGKTGGTATNRNRGGTIVLRASRRITVAHELTTLGRWWGGGDIELVAGTDVIVTAAGKLNAYGASETGDGGTVEISAGNAVDLQGPISVAAGVGSGGGEGQGGAVTIAAGCGGVVVGNAITLTGGAGGGGEIDVTARGDVAVQGAVDARGIKLDGSGGAISVTADGLVTVASAAALRVAGDQGGSANALGVGGTLELEGCRADIAGTVATGGALLEAQGDVGGKIDLRSRAVSLLPFQSNDFGVRVSDAAVVNALGSTASKNGAIAVEVAAPRSGWCSTKPATSCTLDVPDCTVGWQGGNCLEANPDLNGRRSQFAPQQVSISEWSDAPSCGVCP